MRKLPVYGIVGAILAATCYFGCTKINGINNNTVIETPYSLYFSDTAGTLYSSNDGKTSKQVFPADGFSCRAICTDNDNILWVKNNLYISTNNGVNFNHALDTVTSAPFTACNGLRLDLNQSMIINIPSWGEAFVTSTTDPSIGNFLGVAFSLNAGGVLGYWWPDGVDTLGDIGNYGAYPITMTSFTLLTNGVLCGYDGVHNRNFYRTQHTLWNECTAVLDSADFGSIGMPTNHSGTCLPHNNWAFPPFVGAAIDTSSRYTYGHYNNRLIAIDSKGCNTGGAYFSDDTGRNWTAYSGLPQKPLLCICSPFEEICLVGTDSAGLYMLNNNTNTFYPNNNGLGTNIVVRNITYKENIYKNGTHMKYVYLATNQGIYQSTDGGNSWILTIKGNFVAVY